MSCLTSVNIFLFIVVNGCCLVQLFKEDSVATLYKVWRIENIPQNVDTAAKSKQDRLLFCIFQCNKLEYPSFLYFEKSATCLCSSDEDRSIDEHETEETMILYGIRTTKVYTLYKQKDGQKTIKKIHRHPELFDCLALYKHSYSDDGVYVIQTNEKTTIDVWCDMFNGGWTVIQRREDGSEDFYRNWEDYKNGFGKKVGEYWLGLENINYLTINSSSLYIWMETFKDDNMEPASAFAEYSTFGINDESDEYRLTVGGYNGSCNDSMSYHNKRGFMTKDRDIGDNGSRNCAEIFQGAWWYNGCHRSNLNGLYLGGKNTANGRGITWNYCWGVFYSLKKTVMKIRRND